MRWMHQLGLRIRSLFGPKRLERELDEELRFHIERQIEQHVAQGMLPEEARYQALREFGGLAQAQEECGDAWGIRYVNELAQDVRYGLRTMRHNAGFTAVIVLTLALGIGANTAIFSLIDAVLLQSLPVESPDQLFTLMLSGKSGHSQSFSYPAFSQLREGGAEVADVFATGGVSPWEVVFSSPSGAVPAEQVFGEMASGSYFTALGVNAVIGRVFSEQDTASAGGQPVAVISHRFWTRRFAGSPDVVGRSFTTSETVFTIIGVAVPEFFGVRPGAAPDIWVPVTMQPQLSHDRSILESYRHNWLVAMGRPKPGVSRDQVAAALNVRLRQIVEQEGETQDNRDRFKDREIALSDGRGGVDQLRRQYSEPLRILMVVVALVLLVACANVANLLLARATARRREVAIRLAIGAGRRRLIRQWMTESLLLAACGGLAGIGLAYLAVRGLVALVSFGATPVVLDIEPDLRLAGFAAAVTTMAALLFGLAPALRGTRTDVRSALGAVAPGLISGQHTGAARRTLAVVQIGLSLVLVIGAGLFLRTVYNLETVDSGFDRENLITGFTSAHDAGYAIPYGGDVSQDELQAAETRFRSLARRLLQNLEAIPDVRSAALAECGFAIGCNATNCCFEVEGQTREPGDRGNVRIESVSPNYFQTAGMVLQAGREFTAQDAPGAARVAIVNETLARTYFDGANAIGRHFHWSSDQEAIEVVGVVRDARSDGPRAGAFPLVYYPQMQHPTPLLSLVVRARSVPAPVIPQIHEAVKQADRRLTVNLTTVEQQLDGVIARERLLAQLTTLFGLLALLVTCVGLYGLMAYSVARRTGEIGLRMALGAQRSTILWGVLGETLRIVAVGLVIGVFGALLTIRLAERFLFGVTPNDPLTIALAAGVMGAVAALASYFPARRASKVHPMKALRYE
jgi:predicted permease